MLGDGDVDESSTIVLEDHKDKEQRNVTVGTTFLVATGELDEIVPLDSQEMDLAGEVASQNELRGGEDADRRRGVARERAEQRASLQIPDLHGLVLGRRDRKAAVGGDRQVAQRFRMPGERELAADLEIPRLQHAVLRTRDGAPAVGGKSVGSHEMT